MTASRLPANDNRRPAADRAVRPAEPLADRVLSLLGLLRVGLLLAGF